MALARLLPGFEALRPRQQVGDGLREPRTIPGSQRRSQDQNRENITYPRFQG